MSGTFRDVRAAKRKRGLAPPDRYWAWREPSSWHHEMTHVPARAELRQKLHAVVSGKAEDDGNFPDHKKPHVYYW
jgi:hypothetical protein